ncbi:hypothetical protein O7628_27945 [Micromonospora sp. WMMD956]|uniref:hypothetical protein n=1 Tax=Micromonospora sp. WMMD956 TaxID=3016108 RepID=UPI002415A66E|nr:hypothetical protein [Micromonospora sp. WMMD956]MDG4819327.1 hypothetical protein [Micromonospora sp. WMMD956]
MPGPATAGPVEAVTTQAGAPDPGRAPGRDGSPRPSPGNADEDVPAAVGVRLLDAPLNRRDDTRAHKYIVDHVRPGTTIRRRIVVENASPVSRTVDIYPAAAEVTDEGFVLAPGRTENELSSWISVDETQAELGPDDETTVWVTIEVPKRAEAGERYAVVWAETTGGGDKTVQQVARAGIRVYLSVGPGGEPPSGFEVAPLTGGRDADGTPFVAAEVHNTGRRALDLAGELWLADGPGGLSVGPVRAEARTLPLDGRTTIRVALDRRLPDGPWQARLALASGWTKRTATGEVSFGVVPAAAAAKVDRSRLALASGAAASLLVLLLFGLHTYRRRARQPRRVVGSGRSGIPLPD